MENLPKSLSQSLLTIIQSQDLSSWTIHNGKCTIVTLRFKSENILGDTTPVDNSSATWHKSSTSRLNRDKARACKNNEDKCNDRVTRSKSKNCIELQRKSSETDVISALSPEAVEFIPSPSSPPLHAGSPVEYPPPLKLHSMPAGLPSYSGECLPATDGLSSPPIQGTTHAYHDEHESDDSTQPLVDQGHIMDNNNKAPYTGMYNVLKIDDPGDKQDSSDSETVSSDSHDFDNDRESIDECNSPVKSDTLPMSPYIRRYQRKPQHCIMCSKVIKEPRSTYFQHYRDTCNPYRYVNLCEGESSSCFFLFDEWPEKSKDSVSFGHYDYLDRDRDNNPVRYEIGACAPWDPK